MRAHNLASLGAQKEICPNDFARRGVCARHITPAAALRRLRGRKLLRLRSRGNETQAQRLHRRTSAVNDNGVKSPPNPRQSYAQRQKPNHHCLEQVRCGWRGFAGVHLRRELGNLLESGGRTVRTLELVQRVGAAGTCGNWRGAEQRACKARECGCERGQQQHRVGY